MTNVEQRSCNAQRTATVLQKFNRPTHAFLHRAYDHLIAVRLGMTLMVPVAVTSGRLMPIVDRCPVPWVEATEILAADYDTATPLSLVSLVQSAQAIKYPRSPLGLFTHAVLESFIGTESEFAISLTDKDWRHTAITLAKGGQPCRVFIGAAGVRFAFTPDFLEGVL
jgi:hypothetical protein